MHAMPSDALKAGGGVSSTDDGSGMVVLIVEEQEVIRHGLVAIASAIPRVSAVATAPGSLSDWTAKVFDVAMVSTSAILAAEQSGGPVADLQPLLIIVSEVDSRHAEVAIKKKARGYLLQKDLSVRSLEEVLRRVVSGNGVGIPDALASYMLAHMGDADAALRYSLQNLSPREAQVLAMLLKGSSNKEIAQSLGVSTHSVKRYVSALLSKLQSPTRAHLISRILCSGITIQGLAVLRFRIVGVLFINACAYNWISHRIIADSVERCLRAVGDSQLGEDGVHVVLHGLFGNAESSSYLPIRFTVGQHAQYLALPSGELRIGIRRGLVTFRESRDIAVLSYCHGGGGLVECI